MRPGSGRWEKEQLSELPTPIHMDMELRAAEKEVLPLREVGNIFIFKTTLDRMY